MFDTGIGVGDAEIEAAYRPTVRALPELLRAAGIELGDVVAAANSHLHFDHCGQNGTLPGIPIHVQAAEWAAAHERRLHDPGLGGRAGHPATSSTTATPSCCRASG